MFRVPIKSKKKTIRWIFYIAIIELMFDVDVCFIDYKLYGAAAIKE